MPSNFYVIRQSSPCGLEPYELKQLLTTEATMRNIKFSKDNVDSLLVNRVPSPSFMDQMMFKIFYGIFGSYVDEV